MSACLVRKDNRYFAAPLVFVSKKCGRGGGGEGKGREEIGVKERKNGKQRGSETGKEGEIEKRVKKE
jgi:hypothetical protein